MTLSGQHLYTRGGLMVAELCKANFNIGTHELTIYFAHVLTEKSGTCFFCTRPGTLQEVAVKEVVDQGCQVSLRSRLAKRAIAHAKKHLHNNKCICDRHYPKLLNKHDQVPNLSH